MSNISNDRLSSVLGYAKIMKIPAPETEEALRARIILNGG